MSIILTFCTELNIFFLGNSETKWNPTLLLFIKRSRMNTHTKNTHTCSDVRKGNELLIRKNAPERSPDLINFVPASDKKATRNVVNLVSMETSSSLLNEAIRSLHLWYLHIFKDVQCEKKSLLLLSVIYLLSLWLKIQKTKNKRKRKRNHNNNALIMLPYQESQYPRVLFLQKVILVKCDFSVSATDIFGTDQKH